ncbi:MAG: 4-amino-4-deoxychorismate lyase, partial [Mesorhizobium sp.]
AEHNENVARYRALQKKLADDAAKAGTAKADAAKVEGQTDAPVDGGDEGDAGAAQ